MSGKKVIHVEVNQHPKSQLRKPQLLAAVNEFILSNVRFVEDIMSFNDFSDEFAILKVQVALFVTQRPDFNPFVQTNVISISVQNDGEGCVKMDNADIKFYFFKLDKNEGQKEDLDEQDQVPGSL